MDQWLFIFDGLAVGFDDWLNASEAVNCLIDLVESLMTHWSPEQIFAKN